MKAATAMVFVALLCACAAPPPLPKLGPDPFEEIAEQNRASTTPAMPTRDNK